MKAHFRVAGENKRYVWPRCLCGARGKRETGGWGGTVELRENSSCECQTCMVIKDWWLENGKPRLTIRRARMLLKPAFGVGP